MTSWQQYNDKASSFFNSYIGMSFDEIFSDVAEYLPSSGESCLDIGAGSGRDSAALAMRGLKVTAVEPSDKFRALAKDYHKNLDITWVNDSLPHLKNLSSRNQKFDFILMSAVWMHLPPEDRTLALHTAFNLLNTSGRMILTLRLGPAEPERVIYEISTEEAILKAKEVGFDIEFVNPIKEDGFNRNNVTWQIVVLSKS
ncbi:class I SAM-dependent methyltransferase [Klebsiella aerogenes]|uniref:class I SAM-dependent methyltransferase n=1 Tax=Klebsiella aerogenes TaxID=548 RepID=UPI0023B8EE36|nr:class I SAM-dependent methyltransferase [Klebsiella aerogenes]MCL9943877.1 class I SAM-dependent methyltransferase [Klebsiella aerogenes]MEB7532445.1 class I SAM-dependent methyltransferase [Klebsiella aerogenes]WPR87058.1 class I SAM-dependent methyltransferase [Klebsiella aerogenes]HBV4557678.1 class I SAM-dependent methyltransferase [Klebsiella aerogenes]HCM3125300.1 class I SAM-dependent methyltransferase [Klebsiella aerogenes]